MKKTLHMTFSLLILFGLVIGPLTSTVNAGNSDNAYKVTVTNLTRGQIFTPILVASHKRGVKLFMLGDPASDGLATLAEDGDVEPLTLRLESMSSVGQVVNTGGLLMPGQSISAYVAAGKGFNHISLAAMLIPTNDGFFAINGMKAPKGNKITRYFSPVYDAGSEMNDESCDNIPGPDCGGEGFSEADGEGYVHIHAGIHGIGNLDPGTYDWRNPAAKITIQRVGERDDDD